MQVPKSVIKYNINKIVEELWQNKKSFKNYKNNAVVLFEIKQIDDINYSGVLCRVPKKCDFDLFEKVYYNSKDVGFLLNKETVNKNFEYNLIMISKTRIFKSLKEVEYFKNNFNIIQTEKLYNIIFELSLIDLHMLYSEFIINFNINKHKKTKEHILRLILTETSNLMLSNNSDIPLLFNIIKKIYVKIRIKKIIKERVYNNSNEKVEKLMSMLDYYNSNKRIYKPLEPFKKMLIENDIPYDLFNNLTQLQGRLIGRFNVKIKI